MAERWIIHLILFLLMWNCFVLDYPVSLKTSWKAIHSNVTTEFMLLLKKVDWILSLSEPLIVNVSVWWFLLLFHVWEVLVPFPTLRPFSLMIVVVVFISSRYMRGQFSDRLWAGCGKAESFLTEKNTFIFCTSKRVCLISTVGFYYCVLRVTTSFYFKY